MTMNRAIIGVVSAVLLAAVGTFLLVSFVRGAEDRALAGQETVEVLVVTEDVERGTEAASLGDAVSVERIPAKVRAVGSVTSLDDLDGQVAAVDLVTGEQIVATRFATPAQLEAESQIEVPAGLQAITVSLEPQRAVGGQIRPGDLVGLFASFDFEDGRTEEEIAAEASEDLRQELSETSKIILHKLLVTNIQVEQLPQALGDEDQDRTGPDLAPTGNLLVTLAGDVGQAERIVFSAEHGLIWLSAQDEDSDEDGSQLRTPRNIYDD
jgi:pilus assembly protein CpaB